MYRGRFLFFEGKVASAVRSLKEAALALRAEPSYGSWCLALLAEGEALLGHTAAAAAARSEALALRGNDRLSFLVDERRALAWVIALEGRLTDAIEELWVAADMALERGQRCFELIILDDLLRLGVTDAAARARDVAHSVEGSLAEAVGFHARAVASTRGKDLELAASSFTQMPRRRIGVKVCRLDPPRPPRNHTRCPVAAKGRSYSWRRLGSMRSNPSAAVSVKSRSWRLREPPMRKLLALCHFP
jgi:hypothetical protein